MSIHWEHAQFLHNNSACPASQHLIQNRITAAQPRTAPQQKWQLLSKSPLRLKFCMVTREELQEHWLGRMLPRAVKTASREVPPASATTHTQNWSRNQQAKDRQQPITNSQGRYRPTQLLSPGRTLVHHKPEKPYMAQSWESTSHWDPPSVPHRQLFPSGRRDRVPWGTVRPDAWGACCQVTRFLNWTHGG